MISVWGKFYPGTANFEAMRRGRLPLPAEPVEGQRKDWLGTTPYTFYDAFNPPARASCSGRR